MSDKIEITGIRGFGYHGVFDHERKKGQEFFVDVRISLDLQTASLSDQLQDTVNYAEICDLVQAEITGDPVALIERLGGRIADLLLERFLQIKSIAVTVHKPQAPVAVDVLDLSVTIERSR